MAKMPRAGSITPTTLAILTSVVVPITVAIVGYFGKEIASAQQREIEEAKLRYSYVNLIVDILQKKTERTDQSIVCWSWRNLSAHSKAPFTTKEIEGLCSSRATLPDDIQFGTPRAATTPAPIASNFELWRGAKLLEDKTPQIKSAIDRMIANKAKFEAVVHQTTIPWYVIAIIHQLESGGNFTAHLHNGDPLAGPTVHPPAGRGPFSSWEDSAKDAIQYFRLKNTDFKDTGMTLDFFERYNGLGYRRRGVPSPYVWACTDQYKSGRFAESNTFDPDAVSRICGAAAYLLYMKGSGIVSADTLN